MAEPRRLQQILVNLLANAIKFTPVGGEVGLAVEGDETGGTLRFCVWDTGIGIAPEQIERLFRPFVQIDSGLSRQYGGTGLGLVLVKRLAEAHGGQVEVTSTPGAGSRFVVTLPLQTSLPVQARSSARETTAANVAIESSAQASPCVLLAEDNEYTLHAYVDFLTQAGFQVEVARDGFAAVSMARALRPDIILMDIQMPGMDGYAAMHMVRSDPDPAVAGVPILALTALAMPGDRERCLQAGANQYLVKPIGLPALAAHLRAEVKR
jgi:CheY-like chemotaxis protein/anti-sigma regulatory factor (Ser/Thr protein kinase)